MHGLRTTNPKESTRNAARKPGPSVRSWARSLLLLGVACCASFATTSCVTTALWVSGPPEREVEAGARHWPSEILAKLLMTPFTLVIDVLTAPLQSLLLWDEDEEDEEHTSLRSNR
jgi:integral membrane sensor domain MASE1